MDPTPRALEVEELEARHALNVALKADNAEDIDGAERRYQDALRARIDDLSRAPEAPPAELTARLSMHRYLEHIVEHRQLDGPEREFNSGRDLEDNDIPLEALLPIENVELRADAVTSITTAIQTNASPITGRVFRPTVTGRMGIPMPVVPAGEQSYSFMSAGTTAAVVAESAEHDAAAAAITTETVNPFRLTGAYLYTRETVARIGAQFEPLLRQDLRMVMGDALDDEVLKGPGTTPTRAKGIINRINTDSFANGASGASADDSAFDYEDYRRSVWENIDDRYSVSMDDVRIVLGLETWKHALATLNSNNNPQQSAYQGMMAEGATVIMSSRMPAPSAQTSSAGRTQTALWTTMPGNVLVPIWSNINVIADPFTKAAQGQTRLTMTMLFSVGYRNSPANTVRAWKKTKYVIGDKS